VQLKLVIRDAKDDDAVDGCEVVRRSITELCVADHKNDPAILGKWVGNKTPKTFRAWMAQAGNSLLVAAQDDQILAVESVTDNGLITLLYVSPDARFRDVGKALLTALKQRAADRGCQSFTVRRPPVVSIWPLAILRAGHQPANPAHASAIPCQKH
jgi:GNAT superfamily N-acetyltransferase